MNFGDRKDMLALAENRLALAKKTYPKAMLLDPGDVRVIYMVAYDAGLYHEFAVASNTQFGISRQAALRRMIRPLRNFVSHLA
jgi:formate dehydrogenase iron-sulfur subunit